jgi:CIC family chloride channel protein
MSFLSSNQQIQLLLRHPKRLAIVEACIIGFVSGVAAVLLKQSVGWLGGWRVQMSHHYPAWLALPIIGLVGGWIAGWLVEQVSPEAAGSGIPQVKAALGNIPTALNLRVALVKLMSVVLVIGSGINLGRQGPTVQIGAALAGQLSQWIPTSPEYRRQLLAAGAAAGLAAGFNAPIAGLLFVIEELLQDFSGLTLGTAILASFIGAVVSRLLGGQGLVQTRTMIQSGIQFSLQDLPFLLLLGLLAGLLGALFSRGIMVSLALNRRLHHTLTLPWKVGCAGLISGIALLALPATFRDSTGLQGFLAAGEVGWQITLFAFVVKFLLTLLAYGSGAPGGIFAPSLVLGSALGSLVYTAAQFVEGSVDSSLGISLVLGTPTTYALAGMGAFFSAITRGPITAIVIVFEMTTDFNLVLPLMIVSVVAYLIADRIASGSIYNQLLALNGIRLEQSDTERSQSIAALTAETLMQRRVETLSSEMSLGEAIQAFSRSHHRGFPVVDQGKLVGIITQSDLADVSRRPTDTQDIRLKDIMTPQPVTVHPNDPLTQVLYLLNRFKLSRLPVTEGQKLVGIITRADIIRAESDQLSGETYRFGPQPEPSYLVYQTRSPAVGQGRLLVPLSNPQTAPILLRLAIAIARDRQYELECLQVITIPRSNAPDETPVRLTQSRKLLRHAERLARDWNVPLHTEIRVAHDASQAILETINTRHIDLTLMGWKGTTATPGRVFGATVDTLIRQAPCEVVLVKLGDRPQQMNNWLIPIAGGPNSLAALQLLPALLTLSEHPTVNICQIFLPDSSVDDSLLKQVVSSLQEQFKYPVYAHTILSTAVVDAVDQLANTTYGDVIMLGASRESLLKQILQGNIPGAIAHHNDDRIVILVRE